MFNKDNIFLSSPNQAFDTLIAFPVPWHQIKKTQESAFTNVPQGPSQGEMLMVINKWSKKRRKVCVLTSLHRSTYFYYVCLMLYIFFKLCPELF